MKHGVRSIIGLGVRSIIDAHAAVASNQLQNRRTGHPTLRSRGCGRNGCPYLSVHIYLGKFANGAITGAFSRAFNDETEFQRQKVANLDVLKDVSLEDVAKAQALLNTISREDFIRLFPQLKDMPGPMVEMKIAQLQRFIFKQNLGAVIDFGKDLQAVLNTRVGEGQIKSIDRIDKLMKISALTRVVDQLSSGGKVDPSDLVRAYGAKFLPGGN